MNEYIPVNVLNGIPTLCKAGECAFSGASNDMSFPMILLLLGGIVSIAIMMSLVVAGVAAKVV